MTFIAPVAIDTATLGYQPSFYSNSVPFISAYKAANGNLYTLLCSNEATPVVDVWKSSDLGATWISLDHAGAPSFGPQLSFHHGYDGANTITAVLCDGLFPTDSSYGIQFDLLTETWGSASATLVGSAIYAVVIRPSGDAVCIFQVPTTPFNAIFESRVFSGGSFGAALDLTTNAFAVMVAPLFPDGGALGISATVDSTGAVHVVFGWLDNSVAVLFYQRVTPGDSLGTFFQFPDMGTVIDSRMYDGGCNPPPCVVGSHVVLPLATDTGGSGDPELSLYIGTPLSAPAWTLITGSDPGVVNPLGPGNFDQIGSLFDGTTLRLAYSPDTQTLRLCETTDFTTWIFTCSTVFDVASSPLPPSFAPTTVSFPLVNSLGIEFAARNPAHTDFQRFFQPFISNSPSPGGNLQSIINAESLSAIPTGSQGIACTPSVGRTARDPRKPIRGFTS